jgi:ABC-type multidrug transport system ATPase subunit
MKIRVKGLSGPLLEQRIFYFLTELRLKDEAHKLVSKYSGGNKRKLTLALALIGKSSVVLLDGKRRKGENRKD